MTDMHQYIETPIYQVPGFIVTFSVVAVAVLVSAALRLTRHLTRTPRSGAR
jgi:hypothetical protein